MATVIINGEKIEVEGNNVSITSLNGRLTVTSGSGAQSKIDISQCSQPVEIKVVGGVINDVKADGSVSCDNVGGNVSAGGSVSCDDVGGNVSAGGSVTADDVSGNTSIFSVKP